ncbi:glutaminase [Lentimicrobium sp. S6]|uniref:glutaminase n=1 Tax=Lentimicrobium sp. S6 TaxID=2735872 RepID=UPI001556F0C8|nr:glutaminase [Lentimicrobium sp. S6]NPD43938.1 glutaminase [Lentimicrobium sp. S6]
MNLQEILLQIEQEVQAETSRGIAADYIPALSNIDLNKFGMAVHTVDGQEFKVGQADEFFSIQSIAKVFSLSMAMQQFHEKVWERVGKEPSGTRFNSLVQLEFEEGIPRNPFMNAGALVITDMITQNPGKMKKELLSFVRNLAGNPQVSYAFEVAHSEKEAGYRNVALANFLKSYKNLNNEPKEVLDVYYHQSAIQMSCADLSRAFIFLANKGFSPFCKQEVLSLRQSKRMNSLLLTSGLYDAAGDFAYRVGLPGKSGVGGGIVAIIPGQLVVTVWSPGLNPSGNSKIGLRALELFTTYTGISVF